MNGTELREILTAEAGRLGICAQGASEMARRADIDGLVDYYLANPDWCMERNFPSIDLLRQEFANYENKGVYVGRHFNGEVMTERQVYVLHDCTGTVETGLDIEKRVIPMIYVGNGCQLHIVGRGKKGMPKVTVPIYIFGDGSVVSAHKNDYADFRVYKERVL